MPSNEYKSGFLGQQVIQEIAVRHLPDRRSINEPHILGGRKSDQGPAQWRAK